MKRIRQFTTRQLALVVVGPVGPFPAGEVVRVVGAPPDWPQVYLESQADVIETDNGPRVDGRTAVIDAQVASDCLEVR